MESIERQILELHYKVDQLYRLIEVLTHQIDTILVDRARQKRTLITTDDTNLTTSEPSSSVTKPKTTSHKDILDDSESERGHYQQSDLDELLSPDTQIQRLTAQLTAAYHRIASLEEKLLAGRSHTL